MSCETRHVTGYCTCDNCKPFLRKAAPGKFRVIGNYTSGEEFALDDYNSVADADEAVGRATTGTVWHLYDDRGVRIKYYIV